MRTGESVFVDTGAWIALALTRDPLHALAFTFDHHFASIGFRLVG